MIYNLSQVANIKDGIAISSAARQPQSDFHGARQFTNRLSSLISLDYIYIQTINEINIYYNLFSVNTDFLIVL